MKQTEQRAYQPSAMGYEAQSANTTNFKDASAVETADAKVRMLSQKGEEEKRPDSDLLSAAPINNDNLEEGDDQLKS